METLLLVMEKVPWEYVDSEDETDCDADVAEAVPEMEMVEL